MHPVRQAQGRRQHPTDQNQAHISMPPPPPGPAQNGKFRPAGFRPSPRDGQPNVMPPPPPPQVDQAPRHSRLQQVHANRFSESTAPVDGLSVGSSRQNMLSNVQEYYPGSGDMRSNQRRITTPAPQTLQTQRFVPSTPSRRQQLASGPLDTGSLRAPSRTGGGQRMPFLPENSASFG